MPKPATRLLRLVKLTPGGDADGDSYDVVCERGGEGRRRGLGGEADDAAGGSPEDADEVGEWIKKKPRPRRVAVFVVDGNRPRPDHPLPQTRGEKIGVRIVNGSRLVG
ncbi:hypothetical protein [Limnoglobus roseus]|uniref:hypothetical protein n=1 Tax=Limnoglobus roseus TaxID=2598579 RepID=UPI0011EA835D|nr:hypothetical protein [Limnoglobus roseus]